MKRTSYLRRIFVAMKSSSPFDCPQKSLVFPLLLIFIGTFLFARDTFAQLADTLSCGSSITINLGPVLAGNTVEVPITFINNISDSDTEWRETVTNASSRITPLDTAGSAAFHGTWVAHVLLTTNQSDTSGTDSTRLTLTSRFGSCSEQITIKITYIGPTRDSSTFLLQSTLPEVIAVQSNVDNTSRLFYFKNNSNSTITIDSLHISGTNAFSFSSAPQFNFSVKPNDSFRVGLTYQRSSQGSDNGELVIGMPNHPILPAISLQGVRGDNDVVQTQPAGSVYFWLYPNPSQGGITIHTEHLTHAHVTVTDVLGRIEREASFESDWQWSRQIESGGLAPGGTYFVIVTGQDASGTTVREVERVALE
jgi:hypothetical protein